MSKSGSSVQDKDGIHGSGQVLTDVVSMDRSDLLEPPAISLFMRSIGSIAGSDRDVQNFGGISLRDEILQPEIQEVEATYYNHPDQSLDEETVLRNVHMMTADDLDLKDLARYVEDSGPNSRISSTDCDSEEFERSSFLVTVLRAISSIASSGIEVQINC